MHITTAAADLVKNLITVCAQDASGRTVERRDLRREASLWLKRLPAGCVVGIEACSAAHNWAREMAALGLTPRIMAAEFVQPFRKSRAGKSDRNDAEAIAIAVREANMRFVAAKSVEQAVLQKFPYAKATTKSVDGKSLMVLLAVTCALSSIPGFGSDAQRR